MGEDISQKEERNDEYIDIKEILGKLIRNKFFISKITLFSVLISILYAFSIRKIWEGGFQIVLDSDAKNSSLIDNLRGTGLIDDQKDELQTQVGILKSPLVLSEVFEFVKNEKNYNLEFNNWKKKFFKCGIRKGTSILNITYEDNNKKIILPVLQKISNSYQNYSGRTRLRKLELSKNFLKNKSQYLKKEY